MSHDTHEHHPGRRNTGSRITRAAHAWSGLRGQAVVGAVALAVAAGLTLSAGPAGAASAAITPVLNGYTFVGLADWDRDNFQDVLARDSVGDLWLYTGNATGTFAGTSTRKFQIGNGW